MSDRVKIIIGIAVVALFIIGGLFILQKYGNRLKTNTQQKNTNQTTKDSSTKTQAPGNNTAGTKEKPVTLKGLPPLPASPSSKEQQEFLQAAVQTAKEVDTITLTNCQSDVSSIKLKVGASLKIKNNDSKLIVAAVNSANMFPVQPKQSVDAKLKLDPGIHFLDCQHSASDYNSKVAVVEVVK